MITEWNDQKLVQVIEAAGEAFLDAAASVVTTQAKINVSREGLTKQARGGRAILRRLAAAGPVTAARLFDLIGRNRQTGTLKTGSGRGVQVRKALKLNRRGDVDPPGGFPRLRTGNLRRAITHSGLTPDRTAGYRDIGLATMTVEGNKDTAHYGALHELGIGGMPPRPYIIPAFLATRAEQVAAGERAAQRVAQREGL